MSVYNGRQYLPDCIDGINGQTFPDYEAVIVDDGSDDGTEHLLEQWKKENDRVHIIRREHQGLTPSLNLAISHARGQYLARHDSDDISSPYRIAEQVKFLNSRPGAVLAASQSVEFIDKRTLITLYCPPSDSGVIMQALMKGENPLVHGSIVMRKTAFEKLSGGYRFTYCQDYDLYLRISSLGELQIVPEVLYARRNDPSRISIKVRPVRKQIHRLIMQANGIVPWDPEGASVMANSPDKNKSLQSLERKIIPYNHQFSKDKVEAQVLMSSTGDHLERGNKLSALSSAMKAVAACPAWWKTWLSVPYAAIGAVIPRSMVGQWRGKSSFSRYRRPCSATSIDELFSGTGQGLS